MPKNKQKQWIRDDCKPKEDVEPVVDTSEETTDHTTAEQPEGE